MSALLTTTDVAELSGLAPVTIRYHRSMGHLPGRRIGTLWLFERADVDRWLAQPRKRGKPAAPPFKPTGSWTVVTVGPKAKAVHVATFTAPDATTLAACGWTGDPCGGWKRPTLAEALGASGLPLCRLCAARVDAE